MNTKSIKVKKHKRRSGSPKLKHGFVRDKRQEDYNVKYWWDNKRGDVISFVSPDPPHNPNAEIRITYTGKWLVIPVSASLYDRRSAEQVFRSAMMVISREKYHTSRKWLT